jgi:hypothetical protein
MTLSHPLPYLLHATPLKRGRRHPREGYGHQICARPGRRRDARPAERVFSVTSGPVRPSPPVRRYATIPGTADTSPALWELRRWDVATPAVVQHLIPHQPGPRIDVRMPIRQELQRYYPRSHPWTSIGATTTPARGKIHQDDHWITAIVRHATTQRLKPCDTTVNHLPLVYKRRGRSPSRWGGGTDSSLTRFSAFTYDIGTLPQSNLRDLEASPLPPCL